MFSARGSKEELETGSAFAPRLDADGLIPCIAQDAASGEVVMFAWMNATSLQRTIETGEAHYYSRSRQELWHKGGTSGNVQKVTEIRADCDQDVVLIRVEVQGDGVSCHTGVRSCFYRKIEDGALVPAD